VNKISHLFSCHAAGLRFIGASTQAEVANTVPNRMLHAVEPGVFVAAAEHERSEAWHRMYGTPADNNAKPQPKKSQHAVRIAKIWGRFKDEVQSGDTPPHMSKANAEHVMVRACGCLCFAAVMNQRIRAGAPPRMRSRGCGGADGANQVGAQGEGDQERGAHAGSGHSNFLRPEALRLSFPRPGKRQRAGESRCNAQATFCRRGQCYRKELDVDLLLRVA